MGHTYTIVRLHVVFSTHARKPWLKPELQPRVWDYIGGIGKTHGIPIHEVGGFDNHVHILMSLPATVTISKALQTLKAFSSKWLNETALVKHGPFAWQDGYSAFSVSQSNVEKVTNYIRHQAEHHARHSFEDELKSLLRKHGVQFDERYVFG